MQNLKVMLQKNGESGKNSKRLKQDTIVHGGSRLLFPVLETNRLRLDKLTTEDSKSLFDLFSDNSVVKYYDLDAFTERSQASNLIEFFNARFTENSGIRWAIRLKETHQLIGTCGFNTWSPKMKML